MLVNNALEISTAQDAAFMCKEGVNTAAGGGVGAMEVHDALLWHVCICMYVCVYVCICV
jgi:hypothetical protein